jgi:hypothetical protein
MEMENPSGCGRHYNYSTWITPRQLNQRLEPAGCSLSDNQITNLHGGILCYDCRKYCEHFPINPKPAGDVEVPPPHLWTIVS